MVDERDFKEDLPKVVPVTTGPRDPYPTGTPPDNSLVVQRVHVPQERTLGANWQKQSEANLLAHGMIAGGAAYTP